MLKTFCYRTRGTPLVTGEAQKLLEVVSTSGAKTIVFAGGDPSIRPDIVQLIRYAQNLGLRVEVQTNSHHISHDLPNNEMILQMGTLLEKFPNIVKWSLMEFSPVGEGFLNRERYKLDRDVFDVITDKVRRVYPGSGQVDIYRTESKIGTYGILTPSGYMYGTAQSTVNGIYPTIGSILHEHLAMLVAKHSFSKENHLLRYGGI